MELNDCNTEEKAVNRGLIKNYAIANLRRKPKDWVVGCLPGPRLKEVIDIWRYCGVLKRNIYGFSNNEVELDRFEKYRINAVNCDLTDVYAQEQVLVQIGRKRNGHKKKIRNQVRVFDVLYFDFYTNFSYKIFGLIGGFLRTSLKDNGICGYSFYGARERDVKLKKSLVEAGKYMPGLPSEDRSHILAINLLYDMACQKPRFACTSLLRTKYIAKGIPMYTILGKFRSGKHYITTTLFNETGARVLSGSSLVYIGTENDREKVKKRIVLLKKQEGYSLKKAAGLEKQAAELLKTHKKECKEEILYYLSEGVPTKEIADAYNFPVQKVAAYKAHMTMGTYN